MNAGICHPLAARQRFNQEPMVAAPSQMDGKDATDVIASARVQYRKGRARKASPASPVGLGPCAGRERQTGWLTLA